jgi:hypothetical protein
MQALRLNEVLTRVVAWHNRHPLARRINASQVHSIGEVVLPFASAKPLPAGTAGARLPTVAELLAAPENLFVPDAAAAAPAPAAPSAEARTQTPPEEAGGAPALEMPPVLTDVVAEPPPVDLGDAAAPPGEPAAGAAAAPPPSNLALALARRANAIVPASAAPEPEASSGAPPAGRWARLLARLTGRQPGLPPLQAAFSAKYLWPLGLGRIARWARRHGDPRPIAPSDWQRRVVETDIARRTSLRQKGLVHDVPLHLLTAAIGVGDRRIRVLVDARGQVIGPRAYSLPRLLGACTLAVAALAGLAVGPLQPYWQPLLPDSDAAMLAANAASAPLPAASAASGPLPQATASGPLPQATAAASQAVAASAPAVALAGDAASVVQSASAAAATADARTTAPTPDVTAAAASAPAPEQAVAARAALPPQAPGTPVAKPDRDDIRPALSAEERQAAREQAARLRGEPPPPPPVATTVYAVVSRPSRARDEAVHGLALMQAAAARLPPPVPDHSELMNSQGQWRAAWWPFTSLADAERARIMLTGKGLKAEVVEF